QALLFSGEKHEADRATRPDAGRLLSAKEARCLEHRNRTGRIVCGAGADVPRVEMRTHDDDFVGAFAAANLAYRVPLLDGIATEGVRHLDLEAHFLAGRQ